jgi:ABC-2 type transport system permease protein
VAELSPWGTAETRGQYAAIAWMRWRMAVNTFRSTSKKRSTSGLAASIMLKVIAYGLVGSVLIGPIAACGYEGYLAVASGSLGGLDTMLWMVFGIGFFVSINVSPTTIGFDLTPLLRFPLGFPAYLAVRLFFGLFALPTIVTSLCLAAAAVGVGVARPTLFPWAALVMAVFALHNVLFVRMIFAWVDRWLATRRAREILGGIVVFASLGFQLSFTGPGHHGHRLASALAWFAPLHRYTRYFSPSLAAHSIARSVAGNSGAATAELGGIAAFGTVFLAVFAVRLRREFRGENLGDASPRAVGVVAVRERQVVRTVGAREASSGLLPAAVAACVTKELIYLKRSGAQLYGLLTPLVLVFVIARRHTYFGDTPMLLPYAVSYTMIGLMANLYNILGADAAGFNLYMMAPVRLRDVMLAKNLVNSTLIGVEVALTCVAVSLIRATVPDAAVLCATLSWAGFALLTNLSVGNLRSLLAPKRFELGKTRRAVTSRGTGMLALGVLMGTLAIGIPVIYLCQRYASLWLATPVFLVATAGAMVAYVSVLRRVDGIAVTRREELLEVLCKV